MPSKKLSNEEKTIDLLEKILILQLYVNGVNRDQIKKTLNVGSEKVNPIIKYIKQKSEK